MKIEMSEQDLTLCIAALESGANDLRQGILASERLGLVRQDFMFEKTATEMDRLRERLLTAGQTAR